MKNKEQKKTGFHKVNVPTRSILKNLMLGLIYPAVLGTIFYTFLDEVSKQLPSVFAGDILQVKFVLFTITLAFYFADYLYITFTKDLHPLFFFFDLVFVAGLYLTVKYLDVGTRDNLPNARVIAVFYLVFMLLYLVWDIIEYVRCPKVQSPCTKEERNLYGRIIRWEVESIVELLVYMSLTSNYIGQYLPGFVSQKVLIWLFVVLLIWITLRFWIYTMKKAKYFPWTESKNEGTA